MDQLSVVAEVIVADRVSDKHTVFQNYDVVLNHQT